MADENLANLSRHEEHSTAKQPLPNVTTGLLLHEQESQVQADAQAGWCRY